MKGVATHNLGVDRHLIAQAGCPLSFETGGTMGYNCCFFLNFVPLHVESPYNFGGTGPILGVNGHADR
jgi:hypothetical protein